MALLSACHRLVSWHLQHLTPAIVKLDLSRKIDGQMVKWRYLEMADPTLGASHLVFMASQLFIWNIHGISPLLWDEIRVIYGYQYTHII